MPHSPTIDSLQRFAVARTFFPPATLLAAIDTLGFVQADPIRAPARAQDLTLRHRVHDYRVGDLERLYPALAIEEDVFVNYGFMPRAVQALMHPRAGSGRARTATGKRARAVLEFVRARREVHPREVHAHFSHGTVTNYWGGASNATTHLLDHLHYDGRLRVVRRDNGTRVYAVPDRPFDAPSDAAGRRARVDALIDVAVRKYAPLPGPSLSALVARLHYGIPQWRSELATGLSRSRQRLARARIEATDWFWPAGEPLEPSEVPDAVRLLAPFDPLVWDRRRFELFWGWAYRFEAYTPLAKRQLGYYALPLLWRSRVVGWGTIVVRNGRLQPQFGYASGRAPREKGFARALEAEVERMRLFLAPGPAS